MTRMRQSPHAIRRMSHGFTCSTTGGRCLFSAGLGWRGDGRRGGRRGGLGGRPPLSRRHRPTGAAGTQR
eukprot:scaffold4823_cov60-Phaeocystis_antarctica.AAC.2